MVIAALCGMGVHAQPPVVHSHIGQKVEAPGALTITNVGKHQQHDWRDKATLDTDIFSPKSVNFHPDGSKYYVNSLEGCATVVYATADNHKIKVIPHRFASGTGPLWASPSGYYRFTHYPGGEQRAVSGKPVESTFSHGGRYLWVPYYRRTFDINAQDPSAVAIIDTRTDSIVRMMETGPLPNMVATSHDGKTLAVTHWGNNTVGLIDISSSDPDQWHYTKLLVVDYELPLNFGNRHVNRDTESGYCLRGTVFTPDDQYLIVCCMGGAGGLAVIDVKNQKYMGRMLGMMNNVRHIVLNNGYLYLSVNSAGYVQRIKLDDFMRAAKAMTGERGRIDGWENCKVGAGARTIELSPSGKYVFAACNNASRLCVVDTRTMKMIAEIAVDSYPVGLDISNDGKYVLVTSQGRKNGGGNAVNIYRIDYAEPEPVIKEPEPAPSDSIAAQATDGQDTSSTQNNIMRWLQSTNGKITAGALAAVLIAAIAVPVSMKRRKK